MLLFKSSVILQQLISDHFTFFMDHNSKDLGLKQLSQLAILQLINLVFRICERKKKSESENQYFLHSFKSFVCQFVLARVQNKQKFNDFNQSTLYYVIIVYVFHLCCDSINSGSHVSYMSLYDYLLFQYGEMRKITTRAVNKRELITYRELFSLLCLSQTS